MPPLSGSVNREQVFTVVTFDAMAERLIVRESHRGLAYFDSG